MTQKRSAARLDGLGHAGTDRCGGQGMTQRREGGLFEAGQKRA